MFVHMIDAPNVQALDDLTLGNRQAGGGRRSTIRDDAVPDSALPERAFEMPMDR
jgi:hypothetical protein